MKIKAYLSIVTLCLLSFAVAQSAAAQTRGPSANGKYQFSLEDGYTKYVEFSASTQADGTVAGDMFLSDEAKIADQDVDGTGDPTLSESYPGFYIKADFDGLTVEKNQAVMSGTIRDSSIKSFIGQRVLLAVEDNGTNSERPDTLTWGIYPPVVKKETPTDAERDPDEGAGMTWTTSDFERKDDPEVTYPKDPAITSQSFELPAYDFVEVARAAGDIQVNP
jgi:hypothetical protein